MRMVRLLLAALAAALVTIGSAGPAWAHVEVDPPGAAAGALTTFTVTVPNELADQATVSLDLTIPDGVELDSAQTVPGWTTSIVKRPDGTAESVRWSGGSIPVGTFAVFAVRAKVPATGESLSWRAIQHYERTTVAWTGPPESAEPAAVTRIVAPGAAAAPVADVPAAAPASPAATGTDELARSRAALSLALGGAAAVLALAALALLVARRRRPAAVPVALPPVAAPAAPGRRNGGKQRAAR